MAHTAVRLLLLLLLVAVWWLLCACAWVVTCARTGDGAGDGVSESGGSALVELVLGLCLGSVMVT